ncbi:MAG: hypothetical protein IJ193_04165 [Bacilli bacterium]|nr:hypothetical protein [Bacilli bacterium]
MNRNKIFILASGIINILVGLSSVAHFSVYGLITLILGFIILLLGTEEETATKNKNLLTAVAIVSMLTTVIPGVLLMLGISELKPDIMKQEEIVDPESKKIDILLKLGVGMVFISGILFATTTWEAITLPIKLIVLVFLGILFQGLSIFAEQKLKITKTSIMYYILSMSFFFAVCIGICYYGLFGAEVTYSGLKSDFAYAITYFYLALLCAVSFGKYKKEGLLYIIYTAITIGLFYLLSALGATLVIRVLVLSTITLILNVVINKEHSLYKFNNVTSYIYPILLVIACFDQELVYLTSAAVINILNTTYLMIKNESRISRYGSLFTNYLLVLFTVIAYETEYAPIIMVSLLALQTLLIRFKIFHNDNAINQINQIMYAAFTLFLFFIALTLKDFQPALIGCIYLLGNLLGEADSKDYERNKLEDQLRPLGLFLVAIGLNHFINLHMVYIPYTYPMALLLIVYALIHKFSYSEAKVGYFVAFLTVLGLESLINSGDQNGLIQILTTIPTGYLFMNSIPEENKKKSTVLYIALLIDIYLAIITYNSYNSIGLINPLIVIAIYFILNYIFKDEYQLKMIGDFAILAPLFYEVNQLFEYQDFKLVCTNIIELYGLYLIIKYFFKDKNSDRNGIIVAGLTLILLQVIFTTSLVVAIYVGLVGILLIAIGYSKDDLPVLFKAGVVVTIINIVFQLRALWSQLPFYLYLLVGGLAIIGFVTYKEIKKK